MSGKRRFSAGVLIGPQPGQILLGHASGTRFWDIPKGMNEAGESARETALRELDEETGLVLAPEMLHDLGCHAYTRQKDLWLFRAKEALATPLSQLFCRIDFVDRHGVRRPEFDAFRIVVRDELARYCAPAMVRVLHTLEW